MTIEGENMYISYQMVSASKFELRKHVLSDRRSKAEKWISDVRKLKE